METFPKPQSGKSQQISITELHHTTPESWFCFFFNEVFLFFKSFTVFFIRIPRQARDDRERSRDDRKLQPQHCGGGDAEGEADTLGYL